MRKLFFTVLLAAVMMTSTVRAQDAFDTQMKVYTTALKYYDLQVATTALYNAMALKPDRKDLRDSLALLYFAGERYGQAYTLGEEILKDNPKRNDILEMVAVSKQSLGLAKDALADYEALYKDTKQIFYLYQISTLQYQLKRFGECLSSLDQILADEASAKQVVTIRNNNNTSQSVPMRAAALNVKGIVALELNQQDNAKGFFNEAIKLFPDFALAKGNLALIEERQAKGTGTATTAKTGTAAPKSTPSPKAAGR
jgi:tetratricopeptide (TPR) repeat protein